MTNIDTLARNSRLRLALDTLSDEHLSVVLEVAESGDALQIEGSARFMLAHRGLRASLDDRALEQATDDDRDPLDSFI